VKKALFLAGYFLFPLLPVFLYTASAGSGMDSYTLSVALGVYAFVLFGGQFFLASRPRIAVEALGLKGLLALHGMVPVIALILAAAHRILKEANGFSMEGLQASLGGLSLALFAFAIVFAVILMANTFVLKIAILKSFKAWFMQKTGLTYKGARLVHNVTVLAGIIVLVHVFLASSSHWSANPAGIGLLAIWMLFSLGSYARYRLKGRPAQRGSK